MGLLPLLSLALACLAFVVYIPVTHARNARHHTNLSYGTTVPGLQELVGLRLLPPN